MSAPTVETAEVVRAEQSSRGYGNPRRAWVGRVAVAIALIVLALLPFLIAPYPLGLISRALSFALLVVSVDLLTGVMGMPTLGQVAYFGAGAYTAGLVGKHLTSNGFAQLGAGIAVGALLALVTGAVAVRTAGIFFLMVTLAIGELAHRLADSQPALGGSNGLAGIPAVTVLPGGEPLVLQGYVYWWVYGVFLVGLGAAVIISASPLGRAMRGVRDGDLRLRALGQTTYATKLLAYTLAGGIAGAAGTAWVAQTRFMSPGDMGFDMSAFALLAVVIGGAGVLWGPVLGAGLVILVRDWVGGYFDGRGTLLLGISFVLAVYLLPRGIAGIRARWPVSLLPGRSRGTNARKEP